MQFPRFVLAGLAAFALAVPAWAAFDSAYTDIDLEACLMLDEDEETSSASWACPGYRAYPLWIGEGDLRFFISYGFQAAAEPVASQTLPPFNYLGPRMEWRLSDEKGYWFPVATIMRYFVARPNGEDTNQVLVVTRIAEGASCHVAYVDATANANANELARAAADRLARNFDCGADEVEIIGAFEAW